MSNNILQKNRKENLTMLQIIESEESLLENPEKDYYQSLNVLESLIRGAIYCLRKDQVRDQKIYDCESDVDSDIELDNEGIDPSFWTLSTKAQEAKRNIRKTEKELQRLKSKFIDVQKKKRIYEKL